MIDEIAFGLMFFAYLSYEAGGGEHNGAEGLGKDSARV
jgi:hypothetical protein